MSVQSSEGYGGGCHGQVDQKRKEDGAILRRPSREGSAGLRETMDVYKDFFSPLGPALSRTFLKISCAFLN